jgi:hypothetical protein
VSNGIVAEVYDFEQTVEEFQEALSRGPLFFKHTVFERMIRASVPARAHYLLASMDAMGYVEPAQLQGLFTYLRARTPSSDLAAHEAALRAALSMSAASAMVQTRMFINGIADAMGLEAAFDPDEDVQATGHSHSQMGTLYH